MLSPVFLYSRYMIELCKRYYSISIALLAFLVALLPLLLTPHVSDDVINYSASWLSQKQFVQNAINDLQNWYFENGRIHVLANLSKDYTFLIFSSTLAYKTFLVALNLIAAIVFHLYIKALTKSTQVSSFSVLVLCLAFQFRDFHDPVVSFNGLMQYVLIFIVLTLIFHLKYIVEKRIGWLYLTAGSFFVSLLFYEISFIILFFVLVQEWALQIRRRQIRSALPWLALLSVIYIIVARSGKFLGQYYYGVQPRTAYEFSLDPLLFLATYFKQVTASIPFIYSIYQPKDGNWGITAAVDYGNWFGNTGFLLSFPLFTLATWILLRRSDADFRIYSKFRDRSGVALIFSLGLILLPPVIIAMVGRYQNAFGFGNGYLPVYLQYFGLSFLIAFLIQRLLQKYGGAVFKVTVTVTMGLLISGNYSNNLSVTKALHTAWTPQYIFAELLHNSKFRESCLGKPVVVQQPAPWTDWTLMRNVTRAGFRGIEAGKMAGSVMDTDEVVQYCVISPLVWQGRQGHLFGIFMGGKKMPESNSTGISFIYPVEVGEDLVEISLGLGCSPEGIPMRAVTRQHGRWTDYVILNGVLHTEVIRHTQTGISFGCVKN